MNDKKRSDKREEMITMKGTVYNKIQDETEGKMKERRERVRYVLR